MTLTRLLKAAAALTAASAALIGGPALAGASHPRPPYEGPAGPPARMPDGRIATPPRVTGPVVSSTCRKAAYGPKYYAPGSGKTVALTFDDGPGRSTAQIISVLRKFRIPATFFNNGGNEAAHRDLTRTEVKDGFAVGNHTWNHPDMRKLSASAQAKQMDQTSAEQYRLTHTWPCVFRPPFGSYNSTTMRLAQDRRMRFWIWSVDPEDWKAQGSGSAYWVNRIISITEREGGALRHPVVLMHNQINGNPATVSALPVIIRFFQHHDYRFVRL